MNANSASLTGLTPKQAAKYFWLFAAVWFCIWTFLPILMLKSPGTYDVTEQLILGREWILGSSHHPPFAFWCIESAYQLFGNAVAASSFCGAVFSFVGLFAIWRLSRWYVSESAALLIVLASASYRYLNMGNVNFTSSIPPTTIWCLAIFFLFRAVELNRLRDWCMIGAALGVGMLCKYSIGILVVSMVLYLCWERKCRHFWLTPGPWLTTLTAFLIFSPHLYWLVQNDFPPFQFAASVLKTERNPWNHMLMPLYFAGSQLLLILPILISLIPLCGCVWQLRRETSVTLKPAEGPETDMEETAFRKRFLNFMFWFPIIFQFAIFTYSGSECIRPQYGSALWTLTALWYSQYFRNFPISRSFLRTACLPLAVLLCLVIVYWADLHFRYCFTDRPARWHFPCEGIAAALDHAWSEKYPGTACPVLTGDWKIAGPASLRMKERPTVLFYYHGLEEGMRPHGFWVSDEDFAEKGGIVVWKVEDGLPSDEVPEYLKRRFPTAEPATEVLTIPWQTTAKVKPLKIRYAIAPPAEKQGLK